MRCERRRPRAVKSPPAPMISGIEQRVEEECLAQNEFSLLRTGEIF